MLGAAAQHRGLVGAGQDWCRLRACALHGCARVPARAHGQAGTHVLEGTRMLGTRAHVCAPPARARVQTPLVRVCAHTCANPPWFTCVCTRIQTPLVHVCTHVCKPPGSHVCAHTRAPAVLVHVPCGVGGRHARPGVCTHTCKHATRLPCVPGHGSPSVLAQVRQGAGVPGCRGAGVQGQGEPGCWGTGTPGCWGALYRGARMAGRHSDMVTHCQGHWRLLCQDAEVPGCQGAAVPG